MFAPITWPMCENEMGEPISRVMVTERSSARAWSCASSAVIRSARSAGVMRGQGPRSNASRAAATARSRSASRPSGTRAMTSSVCGETTSIVAALEGGTQVPPMKSRSWVCMGRDCLDGAGAVNVYRPRSPVPLQLERNDEPLAHVVLVDAPRDDEPRSLRHRRRSGHRILYAARSQSVLRRRCGGQSSKLHCRGATRRRRRVPSREAPLASPRRGHGACEVQAVPEARLRERQADPDTSRAGCVERDGERPSGTTGCEQGAALKDDLPTRPRGRSGAVVAIGRAFRSCPPTRPPPGSRQGKTLSRSGRLIRDLQQGTVLCWVSETPDGGREDVRISRDEDERGLR